ncbi:HU family DNA-binding protein [Spirosoma pollinicola]|uniref:Integration host factor subunit beta n=1 Tax=Spirosoma pollinicola TaxID=2057025 RepID=A0A2K8YTS8_9BACT|nr:HU family DNA-binding protein [Spirosoma pollinicola]AUD00974.1 integration host factor subunit beta [Spirosoma pollinicola]
MTKDQLAQKIVRAIDKDETLMDVDKTTVKAVLNAFAEVVTATVAGGDAVTLRGFGSFVPARKAAKKARNIAKGETLLIPAHTAPRFNPSDEFYQRVRQSTSLPNSSPA